MSNQSTAHQSNGQKHLKKIYAPLKGEMIRCCAEVELHYLDLALAQPKNSDLATFYGEWSVYYGKFLAWLQQTTNAQFAEYAHSERLDPQARWTLECKKTWF
jgi:hypothetical protein